MTAKARKPWTEAEVREALAGLDPLMDLDDSFWRAIGPIEDSDMARVRIVWDEDYTPANAYPNGHPGTLWADLRPSEFDELQAAVDAAVKDARRQFVESVREALVAVALDFDAKHPDAPRGHWPNAREAEARLSAA